MAVIVIMLAFLWYLFFNMTLSSVNGLPPLLSDQESRSSGATRKVCSHISGDRFTKMLCSYGRSIQKENLTENICSHDRKEFKHLNQKLCRRASSTNVSITYCKLDRSTAQIYIFKMYRWYGLEINKRSNCVTRYILRAVGNNKYELCAISWTNSARVYCIILTHLSVVYRSYFHCDISIIQHHHNVC